MQKCAVLCACVEAGSKSLTHGEKETEEEMRELAFGACGISAATFCFAVRGFYTRQECGPHRHEITTDREKKRSWKKKKKERRKTNVSDCGKGAW